MNTPSPITRAERYNALLPARPFVVPLALFLIVILLRSLDLFVLRLDALPDEIIVSRVLGLIFIILYLQVLRKPVSSIGLHTRNLAKAFLIIGSSLVFAYTLLYAVQYYQLITAGESPRLVFGAINPESGVMGSSLFSSFFLFGQFVNALMEEVVFRGVMLPHFMRRFTFWKANALQSILFGVAHLVFPISSWARGEVTSGEALAQAVSLLLFTTIGGLIFGYLYYRTDNLWTAVLAHLTDNIVGLFFHIQTVSRVNAETDILPLASIGLFASVLVAWIVAKHHHLPALRPWASN